MVDSLLFLLLGLSGGLVVYVTKNSYLTFELRKAFYLLFIAFLILYLASYLAPKPFDTILDWLSSVFLGFFASLGLAIEYFGAPTPQPESTPEPEPKPVDPIQELIDKNRK